jgi:hypothetical protein
LKSLKASVTLLEAAEAALDDMQTVVEKVEKKEKEQGRSRPHESRLISRPRLEKLARSVREQEPR